MSKRRPMRSGDWVNAAAILAVGVFLGLAVESMAKLAGTAFWPVIVVVPVLFGGWFLFVLAFEALFERMFPIGLKPAGTPRAAGRKPLALLMCLPAGIVIGVIGARFGLGDLLL